MYAVYVVDFVAMTALTVSSAMPDEVDGFTLPRHRVERSNGAIVETSARAPVSEVGRRASANVSSAATGGGVAGSASLSRLATGITATLDSKIA